MINKYRKQAIEEVIKVGEGKISDAVALLRRNRRDINTLAEKQKVLKKEIMKWREIINSVKKGE